MKKVPFLLIALLPFTVNAQQLLTLDSCRAMALRNNKQMRVAAVKQDVAADLRRSARTKFLPHVSAVGTYEFTSREISILNDGQKETFGNIGTIMSNAVQNKIGSIPSVDPEFAPIAHILEQHMGNTVGALAEAMNQFGKEVVDAFRTDTRNVWAGSILLT